MPRARALQVAACVLAALALCACVPKKPPATGPGGADAVPAGQLPEGVAPVAYRLELTILPAQERFSGKVLIAVKLAGPSKRVWLHGRGLNMKRATVESGGRVLPAKYAQVDEQGLAKLDFPSTLPAGQAVLSFEYDAPFNQKLSGLYRTKHGDDFYAFTQFEPVDARLAFPCFDEPRFKTPFEVTLTVAADHTAIGNTPETGVEPAGGQLKRVRYAATKPLPTYLVAFAVGPFDVVAANPIPASAERPAALPLRGVAVRGKGPLLRYALDHTPALFLELERYFGSAYPYEKLDVIAMPDFGAGAMENAGAITFRERLLLIDPKTAPESQLRSFANVMAHEIAHHWCGNLVTMPWWNDLWLNEAFATFMAARTVAVVEPAYRADAGLLAAVLATMDGDSRTAARRIRQPVANTHDIANAFDGITYQKGAGVLAMFERYLGVDVFQKGVRAHLQAHAHATATGNELLAALGQAAGKDVAGAMGSFLDQPGVPLVKVDVSCAADGQSAQLVLAQSRYAPKGSTLDPKQTWQVPFCARYQVGGLVDELCTLMTGAQASLPLDGGGCPSWVMPNAEGVGYYRFALAAPELEKLRKNGFDKLTPREKLALADSVRAGFADGSLDAASVFGMLGTLAGDESRAVAALPIEILRFSHEHLLDETTQPALDRFARQLYGSRQKKLGLKDRPRENGDLKLLRADIAALFALSLRDPAARKEMAQLGRKLLGLSGKKPDLESTAIDVRTLALQVAGQEGDAALFDRLYAALGAAQDPIERERILIALSSVTNDQSARALSLSLDPALRVNEVLVPLGRQLADPRTREAAWQYLEQNLDALIARVSSDRAGGLASFAAPFCSTAMADRVQALFGPRIEKLEGGPRVLAATVEGLRLCAAQVELQRAQVTAFFAARK